MLCVIYYLRPTKILTKAYKEAEFETRWAPTYFLIYDNSTETECNRLVQIMPFDWYVWAINKNVYIIENTAGIMCPFATLPAIQLTPDPNTFVHACLTVTLPGIISLYSEPHRVFYDITESSVQYKFTILDALNILFQRYLTVEFKSEQISTVDAMFAIKEIIHTQDMRQHLHKYESLRQNTLDELQQRVYRQTK